jgi:peptidoglycan/xylan/chitin deacetylase (PgdA/CDA1 family)
MSFTNLSLSLSHGLSRLSHNYADWRIGSTEAEKRCYKGSDSILLTFDDHGTPAQIRAILKILAQYNLKVMFFPEAIWAHSHPELIKEIEKSGHVIGNHTASHPNLLTLDDEQVNKEIAAGVPSPWLRAPYGRYNKRIRRLAAAQGLAMCYWTIDSCDWKGTSVKGMRHTILSELHAGAVILFHGHGRHTVELLPLIIKDIQSRGYVLTTQDETWQPEI